MAKKFYAVKEGFDSKNKKKIENLIVESWDECLKYVKGVKGAKYKSFTSLSEAEEYIGSNDPLLRKGISVYPEHQIHSYVDGSYNDSTGKYSYGIVMVKDDIIFYIENGSAEDDSARDIRQIGGELKGAVRSVEYCIQNDIKEIVIVHDYEGVCYHATGYWERREESSKRYYELMNNYKSNQGMNITFLKVDSHTGDLFNEIADEFAKAAAGIEVKGETKKYLRNNQIKVADDEIRNRLAAITGEEYINKIVIEKQ